MAKVEIPVDGEVKGTGVVDGIKIIPDIIATAPKEVPAVEAVTYDKWWISRIIIMAGRPSEPLAVQVSFIRAYADIDGNLHTTPNQEVEASLRIDDLLNEATKDTGLRDTVKLLMEKIQEMATNRGVL